MKKILITTNVSYSKKRGYQFWIDKNWFDYSKKIKINLSLYNYQSPNLNFLRQDVKGVIFSGGNDLSLLKKNKQNIFRDFHEKKLFKHCLKKKIPVIGVCRGFQLISSIFGSKPFKIKNHVRKIHTLILKENNLLNKKKISVNSFHNYGVKSLPKSFEIIGRHLDNSIEIARIKKRRVLCLMFHPERKNTSQKHVNKILKKFLK